MERIRIISGNAVFIKLHVVEFPDAPAPDPVFRCFPAQGSPEAVAVGTGTDLHGNVVFPFLQIDLRLVFVSERSDLGIEHRSSVAPDLGAPVNAEFQNRRPRSLPLEIADHIGNGTGDIGEELV